MLTTKSVGATDRFVGRQDELIVLQRALAEAKGGGSYGLLTVTGEPGIGKTRLVGEFITAARRQADCVEGRVYEVEGALPYGPWIDALDPYLSAPAHDGLRGPFGPVSVLSRLFPTLLNATDDAVDLPVADPDRERGRVLAAFRELLVRMSANRAVVVFLDDLHLADQASIELLHFLVRGLRDRPVLLIASYRAGERSRRPQLDACLTSLDRAGLLSEIQLDPTSVDETGELIMQFAESRSVPRGVITVLHHRSAGNPLFLREILRHLSSIAPNPAAWDLLGESVIPKSISQLIRERTARLSHDARQLLEIAAVAGEVAYYPILAGVSGFGEQQLLAALDEIRLADLVEERHENAGTRCLFRHQLIRDTIREGLGASRRARVHGAIGEILSAAPIDAVSEAELARHLVAADDPATRRRALPHLLAAGGLALAVHANGEAAWAFESALALLGPEDAREQRRTVLEGLGEALEHIGDANRALEILSEALDLTGNVHDAASVHWRIAKALWRAGREDQSVQHLETGLRLLEGEPPTSQAADLRQELALAHQRLGASASAITEAERAVAIAEQLGAVEVSARAHTVLLGTYGVLGEIARAKTHGDRALELSAKYDLPAVAWETHETLGCVFRHLGPRELAEQHLQAGLDAAERMQAPALQSTPLSFLTELLWMSGEWDQALRAGERAVALDRHFSQAGTLPRSLVFTAVVHRLRGDREKARAYLEEALALVTSLRMHEVRIWSVVRGVGAFFSLLDGDLDAARFTGERLIRDLDVRGSMTFYLSHPFALPLLAEVCARAGDESRLPYASRLEKLARATNVPALQAASLRVKGLRGRAKDPGLAARMLESCAQCWADAERPYERARTLVDVADAYAAAGEDEQSGRALRKALEVYGRLEARPDWEAVARRLKVRAGSVPTRLPKLRAPGRLSPREREITRLIATGARNREIAECLCISQFTAETHVRNILAKLGLRSRTELASQAVAILSEF